MGDSFRALGLVLGLLLGCPSSGFAPLGVFFELGAKALGDGNGSTGDDTGEGAPSSPSFSMLGLLLGDRLGKATRDGTDEGKVEGSVLGLSLSSRGGPFGVFFELGAKALGDSNGSTGDDTGEGAPSSPSFSILGLPLGVLLGDRLGKVKRDGTDEGKVEGSVLGMLLGVSGGGPFGVFFELGAKALGDRSGSTGDDTGEGAPSVNMLGLPLGAALMMPALGRELGI